MKLTHAALHDSNAIIMILTIILRGAGAARDSGVTWRREGSVMTAQPILGIDIGGSGIKGAIVDVA
jgi:hypothetical protein